MCSLKPTSSRAWTSCCARSGLEANDDRTTSVEFLGEETEMFLLSSPNARSRARGDDTSDLTLIKSRTFSILERLLSERITELISASRVFLSDTTEPVVAVGSSARFSRPRRTNNLASDEYLRGQTQSPTIATRSVQPNTAIPRRLNRKITVRRSRFENLEWGCAIDCSISVY